jgi:hypothetical protein
VPRTLDNGPRSPRKLLASVVRGFSPRFAIRRESLEPPRTHSWRARSDRATLARVWVGVAILRRYVKSHLPRSLPSLTTVGSVIGGTAAYVASLTSRLRMSLGRSADGIIVVPLLGVALVLGVFAATAATKRSSATEGDSRVAIVPETHLVTVTTPGKKKRVIVEHVRTRVVKRPGGTSTLASQTKTVTGPTKTVRVAGPTKTFTEIVTTVLTVTETVDGKGKP